MNMRLSDIDSDKIKICGRTNGCKAPVALLWTGSYVEFNVKATELSVLIEGPYETYESWIAIEVNGEVVSRRMVSRNKEWITIFRMYNPEISTRVRIIKEVQAFAGDSEHRLNLYEIETDGELLPVCDKALKIEFVGDSITSSEGCMGAREENEWISSVFSHVNSYPYMVGKQLEADVSIVAQSGWGVYASYDCNRDNVLPRVYEDICSVMPQNDICTRWDFSKWKPDVVVINLATNDEGAFHNTDPETMNVLRMNGDEYVEEDLNKVRDAIADFIAKVRRNNPDAYIMWAFGMIETGLADTVKAGVDKYRDIATDDKVEFVALPVNTDETMGSRFHPGRKNHEQSANVLSTRIRALRESGVINNR